MIYYFIIKIKYPERRSICFFIKNKKEEKEQNQRKRIGELKEFESGE